MAANIWSEDLNPFQSLKVLAHIDRMRAIQAGRFEAPVNIAFDLCQGTAQQKICGGVHCTFCMSNLEAAGTRAYVPPSVLHDLPPLWADWGVKSICLAGHHSDPFMYPHRDLVPFLRRLRYYQIDVGINTNGVGLTEDLSAELVRTCKWTGFSINAGTRDTWAAITGCDPQRFDEIIGAINRLSRMGEKASLTHTTCYKFLILPENQAEICTAISLAREIGCRHIQIRPAQLSVAEANRIDADLVESQLRKGLEYAVPGQFGVFGIREKFSARLTKRAPKRCIASPLGSTWMADGTVVICPDRRWSDGATLGNYLLEGPEQIRRKWGGPEHRAMITHANNTLGSCIRCTSIRWHELYEATMGDDVMDINLI